MSHVIPGLLPRAECVKCDDVVTPPCSCDTTTEDCVKVNMDCWTCATTRCIPKSSSSTSTATATKGVGAGALAGAVVGVLVFLAIAGGLFFWYRRSPRFRRNQAGGIQDKPASADDVLNRPEPHEKSAPSTPNQEQRQYPGLSYSTTDIDPESQPSTPGQYGVRPPSVRSNPFSDGHSIQTTGTEGTNVIPIALVAPDPRFSPSRPARSPELQLNLDHINVSRDNLKPGAHSMRSGFTDASRNSYMTSASYASDLLNEAPMIVTPTKGAVRHVVGAVKAEMVDARSPSSPSPNGGFPGFTPPRPGVSSPLANDNKARPTSNPFSDGHTSMATTIGGSGSDSASVSTFGHNDGPRHSMSSEIEGHWNRDLQSRPTSMSTQAGSVIGSVIDIGSATRVNVNNGSSLYRTMVGRLVTPTPTSTGTSTMQDKQREAASAYAQLRESEQYDPSRRTSEISAMSATADSILEAFPFVPPSPVFTRPARTPPASPLVRQAVNVTPASPATPTFDAYYSGTGRTEGALEADLPPPPDRRTLGLSTGSQLSTASSGLGSFPFQIDSPDGADLEPPSAFGGGPRQRASLDTLAITSDLSSYPLGFDRENKH